MPRVNVYIRNEDWDIWQAIDNGSQFLHDALVAYAEKNPVKPIIRTKSDAELAAARIKPDKRRYCKNLHLIPEGRDKCLAKGCKYS